MQLQFVGILLLIAYFVGSIPFGKIVAHQYGIDIQKRGSGNIGFANVRRILGWRAGIVTLCADIAKGLLPTFVAVHVFDPTTAFFVGIVAIVGHVFPVWLRFRGGKGIATGLGVVIALNPLAAAIGAAVYVVSCLLTRVSSHGSLAGLIATAAIGIATIPSSWWQYVALILIALWTLRHNLAGKVPNYDT